MKTPYYLLTLLAATSVVFTNCGGGGGTEEAYLPTTYGGRNVIIEQAEPNTGVDYVFAFIPVGPGSCSILYGASATLINGKYSVYKYNVKKDYAEKLDFSYQSIDSNTGAPTGLYANIQLKNVTNVCGIQNPNGEATCTSFFDEQFGSFANPITTGLRTRLEPLQ